MTVTPFEKAEWSRMATQAYDRDRNDVGHVFSVAASIPNMSVLTCERYDYLMSRYRTWLCFGLDQVQL